jgi:PAS domain S-box-containing protein
MDLAQLIPESTPHCLFVVDEELRLVYGNSNFTRFVEENFETRVEPGGFILELVPEERRHVYEMRMLEVLSGQCCRMEQMVEINGFTRHFDVTYQPLEKDGTWDKVVITFEEITSRKRREIRLLDEYEHLRQALATRETLLSLISHDLRAPIFQLNGLLFMLRQASESRDEARLQMHADDLEERITHLTHTLDNVLSWSSMQRGSLDPQVTEFSLQEVFDHAIGLLKPAASRKNLRIYTKGLRGLTLASDRELVAFLARNLINNAIKFSPKSGKIEILAQSGLDGVTFSVRDYGAGISTEALDAIHSSKRLFSKSGTWGEQGTGLGLNLCYEFVARLGGTLEIELADGGGTLAQIQLPNLSN